MGMLFISHSSQDNAASERLAAALAARGIRSVFLDLDPEHGIAAGEVWQAVLYRRLRSCSALVAVLTDSYLASRWCFAEVALARMQGKHLFGIWTAPVSADAKLPALLDDRQVVDGRTDHDGAVDGLLRGLDRAGLTGLGARVWDRTRSPYPGFSAFEEADAGVFFGRDEMVERGLEVVRGAVRGTSSRLALLLGASGSGKSSLLRAGMAPRLRREEALVVVGPFRPGPDPLDELAWQVGAAFGRHAEEVVKALGEPASEEASLDRVVRRLLRGRAGGDRHALFLIDQFEELLGRPDGHASHAFLRLLARAVGDPEGCTSFAGTLRSDQLGALQSHPVGGRLEWQTLFVAPMGEAQLRQVIEEPARLAELELEVGLAERMIADTTSPQALPLLALTLRRLWERYGDDGLLLIAEYDELGGLHGAVARVAEDALGDPRDEAQLDALRDSLLLMVRLDDNGNAVRQPVAWSALPEPARPILERFVRSRLLVRSDDAVEVAHEGLFTAWRRLNDWIAEDREALLVRQRIAQAAKLWGEARDEGDLWRGAKLDRVLELVERQRRPLPEQSRAFIDASVALRQAALEEKRRQERERDRLSRVALGRGLAYQALGEARDRPQRGLLLAVAAAEATTAAGLEITDAAENALRELLSQVGGRCIGDFGSRIRCMALSPDGVRAAAGCDDGTVGLAGGPMDSARGRAWHAHDAAIVAIALDGPVLVTRAGDGAVRLWDANGTGEAFREVVAAGAATTATALGAGPRLAVAVKDAGVRVLDLGSGTEMALPGADAETRVLSFSPDRRWLVDARADGTMLMWALASLADQPQGYSVGAHQAAIKHVVWAADGSCVVTSGEDGMVRRWSFGGTPSEISLTELRGTGSPIQGLAVSADGQLVVAGTWHSETLCWLADDGFREYVRLEGHGSSVGSVAVSADGSWVATASPRDNFAMLWPSSKLRAEPSALVFRGEDRWLEVVRFSEDGSVLAGSWAGTIRRWDRLSEEPWVVPIPGVDLNRRVLSHDGSRLLAAGGIIAVGGEPDHRAKLVDVHAGRVEPIDDPAASVAVAMTPDGRVMVIGSEDGQLCVRDRTTGAERRVPFPIEGWFGQLAIDPSGRWLVASGSSSSAEGPTLFDLERGAAPMRIGPDRSILRCAVFDDDGDRLLTAFGDGDVVLWRRDGDRFAAERTTRHDGVWWCAFRAREAGWISGSAATLQVFSADGAAPPLTLAPGWTAEDPKFALARDADRVAVAAGVRAVSWDLAATDPEATRIELPRHEGYLEALAVSDDGRRIATAMIDGGVRLWSPEQPASPLPLPGHRSGAMLVAFVEGDRRIIIGDSHDSIAIWDLDVRSLIGRARAVAGRDLTAEETARFLTL